MTISLLICLGADLFIVLIHWRILSYILYVSDDNYSYEYGNTTVIFRGSSSPSECLTIISNFLRLSYDTCYPKPCAIGSIYQPSVGSDIFYAVAVFAFVASDLKATDSSGRLDIDKLNKTAHIYCSKVRQLVIFLILY